MSLLSSCRSCLLTVFLSLTGFPTVGIACAAGGGRGGPHCRRHRAAIQRAAPAVRAGHGAQRRGGCGCGKVPCCLLLVLFTPPRRHTRVCAADASGRASGEAASLFVCLFVCLRTLPRVAATGTDAAVSRVLACQAAQPGTCLAAAGHPTWCTPPCRRRRPPTPPHPPPTPPHPTPPHPPPPHTMKCLAGGPELRGWGAAPPSPSIQNASACP